MTTAIDENTTFLDFGTERVPARTIPSLIAGAKHAEVSMREAKTILEAHKKSSSFMEDSAMEDFLPEGLPYNFIEAQHKDELYDAIKAGRLVVYGIAGIAIPCDEDWDSGMFGESYVLVNDFIDYAAGYHVTFMVERRKPSHENKRNRAAQDWLADVNPDLSNMTNKEILAALKIAYPDLFITGGERWIRYQKVFPKKEPGCKPKRK